MISDKSTILTHMSKRSSHVIGIDDAPFAREHRGDVLVVGAVYAGARLEGVLSTKVRRDGANATHALADLVRNSKFRPQLNAVLLQGIALAGFNVVDIHALHDALKLRVLVVARRKPNMGAIRSALLQHVRGGKRKWALIEAADAMEPCAGVFIQRAGLSSADAAQLVRQHARNGVLPEPLRTAHLIAGGIATGQSCHRA